MAKARNQTLKALYLYDILCQQTDENHPMSARELIDALALHDISAERKSIYDDIEALRTYGLNVERISGREGGFYVADRTFEDVELQLLVDAVQASRFITDHKSNQLVRKLSRLTNRFAARKMQHLQPVTTRVKSMNESIYYMISIINDAITENVQITFRYFDYTIEKKKAFRHEGQLYHVSPYVLVWNHENYYLIAYDSRSGEMRHYRVDRMENLNLTDQPRDGKALYDQIDMKAYTRKLFNMYNGKEETVHLRLPNRMIHVVIDTFGREVAVYRDGPDHFVARITVAVSPQFYGWVFGLGDEAEITHPEYVRAEYRRLLTDSAAKHNG